MTLRSRIRKPNPNGRKLLLEALEDRRLLTATRLDDPQAPVGTIEDYEISPDGQFGVYVADGEVDGVQELYSVRFSSGAATKLSGPLVDGGDVVDFQISPDSGHVVYRADQDSNEVFELYSVAISGGDPIKLNGPLVDGGDVARRCCTHPFDEPSYQIGPNSDRVTYHADQDSDEMFDLYSVPLTGGETTKLSASVVEGAPLVDFQFSANGTRVVFQIHETQDEVGLYSIPTIGGDAARLSEIGYVRSFVLSPDSRHVVYRASEAVGLQAELFSIAIDGGAINTLYGRFNAPASVGTGFKVSPDSSTVLYVAAQDFAGRDELFATPIGGGGSTRLNGFIQGQGDVRSFDISPDGERVVYRADQEVSGEIDLYSVPSVGGDAVRLNGPHLDGADVWAFAISPDSNSVVYHGVQEIRGTYEIYSTSITGGTPTKLNGPQPTDSDGVVEFRISGDSSHVVFLDDQLSLQSVEISGSNPVEVKPAESNPPRLSVTERRDIFRISPDSQRVVFADRSAPRELYSVPLEGPPAGSEPIQVNQTLTAVGNDVTDVLFSAAGEFVVYQADHETESNPQLYSVSTSTGRVRDLSGGRFAEQFEPSDDGEWVVFRSEGQLFGVAPDGSQSIELNDLVEHGHAEHFVISPDSTHVVFLADLGGVSRLYSVPTAGGTPEKLNPALVSGGEVEADFTISPDSTRVIYRADQDTNNVVELFSVPTAGGDTEKLNPTLGAQRSVRTGFAISPDGSRVVYLADQEADNLWELFSVPVLGGEAVRLNEPLPVNGDVGDTLGGAFSFAISADSTRVVYRAEQNIDNVWELYSVPLAGGDAVRLNEPLPANGDVIDARISSDSSHVVFRADPNLDNVIEIFSVPLTGGSPVRLNDPLTTNNRVLAGFQISNDGRRVVYETQDIPSQATNLVSSLVTGGDTELLRGPYTSLQGFDDFALSQDSQRVVFREELNEERSELFSVPIIGGSVIKLNGELVSGGSVESFQLSSSDDRLVYLADQDIDEQTGLYLNTVNNDPDLLVSSSSFTETGFAIDFNQKFEASTLNLHDTETADLGLADVVLVGAATGVVPGSLVVDPELQSVQFVKTGGPLVPDDYTIELRSSLDAFKSQAGQILDGDGDGTNGDSFVSGFTVPAPPVGARVVSIPDFVRGPGQAARVPAGSLSGIPVSISDGEGVVRVGLRLSYDPSLLSITGVDVDPTAPPGSFVATGGSTPGELMLSFSSPTPLASGRHDLFRLQAVVPADNTSTEYGRQHVLDIHGSSVIAEGAQELPVISDDGLHVVAYPGDVTGDGRITAIDAGRVARVAAQLDSGFTANLRTDPALLGDVGGNGRLNGSDAGLIARAAAGLPVRQIPPIPAGRPATTNAADSLHPGSSKVIPTRPARPAPQATDLVVRKTAVYLDAEDLAEELAQLLAQDSNALV